MRKRYLLLLMMFSVILIGCSSGAKVDPLPFDNGYVQDATQKMSVAAQRELYDRAVKLQQETGTKVFTVYTSSFGGGFVATEKIKPLFEQLGLDESKDILIVINNGHGGNLYVGDRWTRIFNDAYRLDIYNNIRTASNDRFVKNVFRLVEEGVRNSR